MTRLRDLQARFHDFLLGRDVAIEPLTVGTDRLPAADRLAVYGDAYRLRLLEVLGEDFPGLHTLLGDEEFQVMGRAYIDACPSEHPSVRWFGARLPDFLKATPPYDGQPALAEMADLEWTQGEVTDAADSPLASEPDLAGLDASRWPGIRLTFQHALRRRDWHWNVPAVWRVMHEEEAPPELERAPSPIAWLFWRRDLQVHWRSLDDNEHYAIDAALGGATFGEICEGLLSVTGDDQVPLRAASFLKRWINDELVARIEA